jgi:hypothetical protein
MNSILHNPLALSILGCSAPLFCACVSPTSPEATADSAAALANLRDDAKQAAKCVDDSDALLARLASASDSEAMSLLEQYGASVEQLSQQSDVLDSRARESEIKIRNHLRAWADDLLSMSDPDLRQVGEQRRAKLAASFATVERSSKAARMALASFIGRLEDVEKLVRNDFGSDGIHVAKNLIQDTAARGKGLRKNLDGLVAEVARLSSDLAPSVAWSLHPVEASEPTDKSSKGGTSTEAAAAKTSEVPRS